MSHLFLLLFGAPICFIPCALAKIAVFAKYLQVGQHKLEIREGVARLDVIDVQGLANIARGIAASTDAAQH